MQKLYVQVYLKHIKVPACQSYEKLLSQWPWPEVNYPRRIEQKILTSIMSFQAITKFIHLNILKTEI